MWTEVESSVKRVKEVVTMLKQKMVQSFVSGLIGCVSCALTFVLFSYVGLNNLTGAVISMTTGLVVVLYVQARYFPREQPKPTEEETESPPSDDASD